MAQTDCTDTSGTSIIQSTTDLKRANNTKASPIMDARSNPSNSNNKENRRCLYCGNIAALVWVHGHGQCASCGINVEECCRGESCHTDS